MRFDTIEVGDINYAREVIQQAVNNLDSHANLTSSSWHLTASSRLLAAKPPGPPFALLNIQSIF